MNTFTMMMNLWNRYHKLSFTDNYILGFTYKGLVYRTTVTADIVPHVLTLDKASRGAGYSIRFKPTVAQKLFLMTGAQVVCSVEYFKALVENSIYNSGEIFEKLVTESFGQTWEKDNIPFTQAGDVEVNGVAYQIKFEKATFITEKSLARFEA